MKKLLLSSALLITSSAVFAQLYIQPAPNGNPHQNYLTDSYVYVKGEVLYVGGTIELHKNKPASPQGLSDAEASIYLRGGGQLIQGGNEFSNKGDGFLSVLQSTDPTNAWAYYYWCSPVGNPDPLVPMTNGTNKNFGIHSIYEYPKLYNSINGLSIKARAIDITPYKEGFTNNLTLTISKRWLYTHMVPGTEAEDSYLRINEENAVPPGFGFTMKGVNWGDLTTNAPMGKLFYDFRGRPNNGDFTIPVEGPSVTGNTNPPTAANINAKMTLTGNPYPSALDLNKLFWDPDNTSLDCIYYYDEDRSVMSHYYSLKPYGYGVWVPLNEDPYDDGVPNMSYTGAYTQPTFNIWNAAGGHGPGGGGTGRDNPKARFAPIGQGFMFVGNGDPVNEAFVKIKNTHRIYIKNTADQVFYRPTGEEGEMGFSAQSEGDANRGGGPAFDSADSTPQIENLIPMLRLYVVFDDALTRDMLLVFSPETTDGYDRGYDALSPGGMKSDAYFPIGPDGDRKPYVIQGTNYEPRKMIPVSFKLHKESQIEVRAVEENRKPYEKVYLFDRQENIYRPLSAVQTAAGTFTLPAGVYDNRFFLVFRDGPRVDPNQDLTDTRDKMMASVNMFQNNPARQLEIKNPDGYTLKAAYLYDMNGKLVITDTNLGDSSNYSIYTGNLSDAMYMVKLVTSEDVTLDYKVMVINK
ncbi:T9SS type A sorting domain-containing protein [Aequorivita sp. H23M31]|uniref:T9SS type A sorting domain-containing protein n=1 Tax=Aequorivita ciconiae TaxID=2494375 RepID=A0A410G244_9FLAO|nr:T9SS type A sorting domain-containing protein [Aequorivita sp. H23M31]QAA81332.1 T9SS type A sorting domain-containing protein [Aequorivita sp. H23M31]